MKGTMADYEIASVAESPLIDVFPFSEDAKERQAVMLKQDVEG